MKRNWELVRLILERVEAMPADKLTLRAEEIPEFSAEEVVYHFQLLKQAGLIEATMSQAIGMPQYGFARAMTWHGHEFLDAIRSDKVWNKVKSTAKEKGVDLTFEVIKELAILALKGMLGG